MLKFFNSFILIKQNRTRCSSNDNRKKTTEKYLLLRHHSRLLQNASAAERMALSDLVGRKLKAAGLAPTIKLPISKYIAYGTLLLSGSFEFAVRLII